MDSPVKLPDARKTPRCAPQHTKVARKDPENRGKFAPAGAERTERDKPVRSGALRLVDD